MIEEERYLCTTLWIEPPRSCAHCRLPMIGTPDAEGLDILERHDPCIARMPGVLYACCGHGSAHHDSCYVYFDDAEGLTLYGNAARAALSMLGGNPPPAAISARASFPFGIALRRLRVPGEIWPDDEP